MDRTDDLWTAIREVLPDAEEVAAAVAAELGEPLDDVRPSVLIGTIALNGQLGPEAAAVAAIEAELGRLQPRKGARPPRRPLAADSLDDLLAETRALEAEGSLDLETIVAIQRASGAIAARTDRPPGRPAAPLRRHATPDLGALRRRDAGGPAGPGPPRGVRPLPPPLERADLARRHRRLPGRRARHPRPHRGGPPGCAPGTPRRGRRRRSDAKPGCAASRCDTAWTPTGRTAWSRSRRAPRPTRSPSGRASARRSSRCSRDGSATCSGRPPRAPKASAQGSGCRPCCRSWGASLSLPATTGPG